MADRHARFTALLEPLWEGLARFAYQQCWDKNSAEDCLQEAVLVAYQKFDSFTPGTSFKAWTYRILINVTLNQNSKTRRSRARKERSSSGLEPAQAAEEAEQAEACESLLADPEPFLEHVSDQVRGAVKSLQRTPRAVFLLRATQGFRTSGTRSQSLSTSSM